MLQKNKITRINKRILSAWKQQQKKYKKNDKTRLVLISPINQFDFQAGTLRDGPKDFKSSPLVHLPFSKKLFKLCAGNTNENK